MRVFLIMVLSLTSGVHAVAQPCNPVIDGTYCATAGAAPPPSIAPIQSLSSDLAVGSDPPATLGAITFNSNGTNCIALFRRMSCGGP